MREISIPDEAKLDFQHLISHENNVSYLSFEHCMCSYSVIIWHINYNEGGVTNWERVLRVRGLTIGETPALFIDEDLRVIMEYIGNQALTNDSHLTKIYLSRINSQTDTRSSLHSISWREEIELKFVTLNFHGLFSV